MLSNSVPAHARKTLPWVDWQLAVGRYHAPNPQRVSTESTMPLEADIATLTLLVQRMVDESGDPTNFDARAWLDHWLMGVVPALGDRRPIDVLKETGGLGVVSSALARAQSSVFS